MKSFSAICARFEPVSFQKLQDMPEDMHIVLFKQLEYRDALSIAKSCKQFKSLIDDNKVPLATTTFACYTRRMDTLYDVRIGSEGMQIYNSTSVREFLQKVTHYHQIFLYVNHFEFIDVIADNSDKRRYVHRLVLSKMTFGVQHTDILAHLWHTVRTVRMEQCIGNLESIMRAFLTAPGVKSFEISFITSTWESLARLLADNNNLLGTKLLHIEIPDMEDYDETPSIDKFIHQIGKAFHLIGKGKETTLIKNAAKGLLRVSIIQINHGLEIVRRQNEADVHGLSHSESTEFSFDEECIAQENVPASSKSRSTGTRNPLWKFLNRIFTDKVKKAFVVNDEADVRVNGSSHGGSTQFGFDKDGIIAEGNVTAANKSIPVVGGNRGSGLLSPLLGMFGRRK